MKAQAITTREQGNNENIYDVGWQPSHGENGGVGKKKKKNYFLIEIFIFTMKLTNLI